MKKLSSISKDKTVQAQAHDRIAELMLATEHGNPDIKDYAIVTRMGETILALDARACELEAENKELKKFASEESSVGIGR